MRLIDADELRLGKFVEPRTEWHKGWNDALDAASTQAPTISPSSLVKRGRWILNNDGSGTCDQCRRTQIAVWDFDNAQKYCGHCGALMED